MSSYSKSSYSKRIDSLPYPILALLNLYGIVSLLLPIPIPVSNPRYAQSECLPKLDKMEQQNLVIATMASLDDVMRESATRAGFLIPAICVGCLSARPAALPMCPRKHCAYCADCYAKAFSASSSGVTCPLCRAPFGLDSGLFARPSPQPSMAGSSADRLSSTAYAASLAGNQSEAADLLGSGTGGFSSQPWGPICQN